MAEQLTLEQFGEKIKAKYPQYKDIATIDLANKVLQKYPEYKSSIISTPDSTETLIPTGETVDGFPTVTIKGETPVAKLDQKDYSRGFKSATYDIQQELSQYQAQNDTSGKRPSQYAIPAPPKPSPAEDAIIKLYESKLPETEDYSLSSQYNRQQVYQNAQADIDLLKDKSIPYTEKKKRVDELINQYDENSKRKEAAFQGSMRPYNELLFQAQQIPDEKERQETINQLLADRNSISEKYGYTSKETKEAIEKGLIPTKYIYDKQEADKLQKEFKNNISSIVQLSDQFTVGFEKNLNFLDQFTDDQLRQSFGELGVDKTEIANNPEAAKLAYNQKPEFTISPSLRKSTFQEQPKDYQVKGNPTWANQIYQRVGGNQVISNFKDLYTNTLGNYSTAIEEYNSLIEEYNQSPSEQSYSKLNDYKENILNPLQDKLNKIDSNLKRLYKLQDLSYAELSQWEDKQAEELNLDLSTFSGQMTAGLRTLANKNTNIFLGWEDALSTPKKLFLDENEYYAEKISRHNRYKESNFAVPEKYHSTKLMEEYNPKDPKGFFERVNWSNLAAKNIETTAFSLEIAGMTALTGGGANAIIPVTVAMTYGDSLYNLQESGLGYEYASTLALFQSLVEGLTERISPLEAKIFNPDTYTGGAFKQLSKKQIIETLYRDITGKPIKKTALDYLLKGGKAATKGSYVVLQETAEELAADPLNNIINVVAANNIQGYTYDPISMESLKSTAITAASTMALMGLWGTGTTLIQREIPSYQLDLATRPDYYLSSLMYSYANNEIPDFNLKNGLTYTSRDMYNLMQEEVETLQSLYLSNKQTIDNLSEKYQQARYIGLLRHQKQLQDRLLTLSPTLTSFTDKKYKVVEDIENQLNEIQKSLSNLSEIAFNNLSLPKEERNKIQEERVYSNTKDFFTDEYISSLVIPDQILTILSNLEDRYAYAPTQRMKELVSNLTTKLTDRFDAIMNVPTSELIKEQVPQKEEQEVEEITPYQREIQEIDANTDLEDLQEQLSNITLREDLTKEQKQELYDKIDSRIAILEDEANTIVFNDIPLKKGQWIKVDNQLYKVKSIKDDKWLIAEFADGRSDIQFTTDKKFTIPTEQEVTEFFQEKPVELQKPEIKETVDAIEEDEDIDEKIPDSALDFKITNKIRAIWNKNTSKFEYFNSKNKKIGNINQLRRYSERLSVKPNILKVWWNELLTDNQKAEISYYLHSLLDILNQGQFRLDEAYLTDRLIIMKAIRGMFFTPSQVEEYVTDVNLKKWVKDDGQKLDVFVKHYLIPELEENGFSLDEDEAINMIYELMNEFPNGITKKHIEAEIEENNPARDLIALEEEFVERYGLDINYVLEKLQTEIEEYEKSKPTEEPQISEDVEVIEKTPEEQLEDLEAKKNQEIAKTKEEFDESVTIDERNKVIEDIEKKYEEQSKKLPKSPDQIQARITEIGKELDALVIQPSYDKAKYDALREEADELSAQLPISQKEIEETSEEIEKDNKKEDNSNKKVADSPKRTSILGTIGRQPRDGEALNKFVTTWENLLQRINDNNLQDKYFVTIVSGSLLPQDQMDERTKEWYEKNPEKIAATRIAVITDKEGKFLYFTEEGNDNGSILAYASLPTSKSSVPLAKEPTEQEIQRLNYLRTQEKPITLSINEVSKGVILSDEKQVVRSNTITTAKDLSVIPNPNKLYYHLFQIGENTYSPEMDTIQQPLADALMLLIRKEIPEKYKNQLPENLRDSQKERFRYIGEVFFNKSNGKLSLDKDGKVRSNGIEIPRVSARQLFSSMRLNITPKLFEVTNFPLITFENDEFKVKTYPTYKDFLLENSQITIFKNLTKGNRYITFGNEIAATPEIPKETPVETNVDTTLKPKKRKFTKFDDAELFGNADFLKRSRKLKTFTTPEQEKEAEEWFKTTPLSKSINFQDFRNIANSDAYATWSQAAITLYQGGKYSDLYHEAWHEFSQLYLTPLQKAELYNEVRKAVPSLKNASYLEVEEHLAEDFYKYSLSFKKGNPTILNNQPKRNSLFRRIAEFLRELFTGTVSLQTYYERLYSGNINKYQRNLNNAIFGKLNKAIEVGGRELSLQETKDLMSAIDRVIATVFEVNNIPYTNLYTKKGALSQIYNLAFKYFSTQAALAEEYYNQSLGNLPQAESQELSQIADNLAIVIEGWDKIKEYHRVNTKYLKVAKEYIDDIEEDDKEQYDSIYDNENKLSSKEQASYRVLYTVASLPKYSGKQPVANPFIPSKFIEKDGKILEGINQDVVDFDTTWNLLSKTLQNTIDYTQIHNKLTKLAERRLEIKHLLAKLPLPDSKLDKANLAFRNQFIQDLSKPVVQFYKTVFRMDDGKLSVNVYKSGTPIVERIRNNFDTYFQTLSKFVSKDTNDQNYLDTPSLLKEFTKLRINTVKSDRLDFLKAIGFELDEKTINSEDFQEILKPTKDLTNPINQIYKSIEEYSQNKTEDTPLLTKPLTQLSRGYKQFDKVIFSKVNQAIDNILSLEAEFNDNYYSDSIVNSNGDPVWQVEKYSLQTLVYNYLSDYVKYPTYQDLLNSDLGFIFDISKNPDMDNIYINSLFNLQTGERRTYKGKPVQLSVINIDGLEIQPENNERDGTKTTSLTPTDYFITQFNSLLTNGIKENVRYGDKNSSKGTLISAFFDENNRSSLLPTSISDFNQSVIPQKSHKQLDKILLSELRRNKLLNQGIGKFFKNFNKNAKKLGLSDYLTNDLQNILIKELTNSTPEQVIANHREEINNQRVNFFTKEINKSKSLLDKVSLPYEQKVANSLQRYNETTLLRAFTVNNWILNAEHIRLLFSDIRFYDAKEGKVEAFKDPFKRFSKSSSTGLLTISDYQTNQALSEEYPNLMFQKAGYTTPESNFINTVIFQEDERDSKFLDTYKQFWQQHSKNAKQVANILKAFKGMKVADGQGYITLDFYKNLKVRQGSDHWTDKHQYIYTKIAENQPLTEDELQEFPVLFNPIKIRIAGFGIDPNGYPVPLDYKFALIPLLPQAVKNTPFEKIHDNLLKQGVGIALFESGSKHSALLNEDGKFNPFYSNEEKTEVYTGDYTLNKIPVNFIFDVLNIEPTLKDEVTFSTQLRRLLFSNFFKDGKPRNPKMYNNFKRIIQELYNVEKEQLLTYLDAKLDEKTDKYILNEEKLSKLLTKEFDSRDLPDNLYEILSIVKGKFKYTLDASVARQTIESIAISIVDNRLRKQKAFGEALIQASSSGFEKFIAPTEDQLATYGTNDLPFYIPNKDKTTAAKVKVSIATGDFKNLLKLREVIDLSDKDNITTLQALNTLLKDKSFVDKYRKFISITSVRIPVQGHNSMEFFEVYEFLPENSGNIIIVPPELVAKSGGDFDVDKLTSLLPQIYLDSNSQPQVYSELTDNQIDAKYDELKKELENEFVRRSLSPSSKIIADIFGISPKEMQSLISQEIFEKDKLPSKENFRRFFKKAALQNSLNEQIREVLEQPENFQQLMLPNSTDMFEPYADELRTTKLGKENNKWSNIPTILENVRQFTSNLGGKRSLGVGAIWNTFFSQLQSTGAYLNNFYTNSYGTEKEVNIRLPHNRIEIDGKSHVSVSKKLDANPIYDKKHLISESISQLMNGWVDIAKKDWVYYMNGVIEMAPTQLYMLVTGIPSETMVSFTNQPVINDYLNTLQNNKSYLLKLFNPQKYNEKTIDTIVSVYEKYVNLENYKFIGLDKEVITKENLKKNVWILRKILIEELRKSEYNNIFSPEYLKEVALGNKPVRNFEQALLFTHFLELKEQAQMLGEVNQALNADRSKNGFLHKASLRKVAVEKTKQDGILPVDIINKLSEETTVAAFNSQTNGIDATLSKLFGGKQLFTLTNNPKFNREITLKWNNDTELKFTEKFNNEEDFFKTIKNDFISFIFQNYVSEENTLITDKVLPLLVKSPNSLGNQLSYIKKNFPDLVKNNTLLQILVTDSSKNDIVTIGKTPYPITNIKLSKEIPDKDYQNLLTKNFLELINYSQDTSENNLLIQNFGKNLANLAFLQAGLNKTPFSFTNIIPQEIFANNISQVINDYVSFMETNDRFYQDFNEFYQRFKENNSKFYTITEYIDEADYQVYSSINKRPETFRFKDYRIDKLYDKIGNKETIEKIKNEKEVVTYTYTKNLPQEHPDTLFIYETDENNVSSAGSGIINEKTNKNIAPIFTKHKASAKPEYFFKDANFEENKIKIDNSINQILNILPKYKKIAFPTQGFQTETSNLPPKTLNYLFESLKNNFNFTDPNYSPKIPLVEESQLELFQEFIYNIEVVNRYSNEDVKNNPDKIYVFGDNLQRVGTGGQAQIRNNPNAFGIATKLKPTNNPDAFMTDKDFEKNKNIIDSDINFIKLQNKTIVFPKDGLGTGLAKLKEKAPKTYNYLKNVLLQEFGFNNDTGELVSKTNEEELLKETGINPDIESNSNDFKCK